MDFKLTDGGCSKPKYKQLIDLVAGAVRRGELREGSPLPSINEACRQADVSRDTVVKAYSALKRMGIASSAHGKEFYILSTRRSSTPRTLVIIDDLSMYKQQLVAGIREELGSGAELLVLCHNNKLSALEALYSTHRSGYEACAIIPALDLPGTFHFLRSFPNDAILVLDRFSARLGGGIPAVYQDFEPGVKSALAAALPKLRSYKRLVFLQKDDSQIMLAIQRGVESFCKEAGLCCAVSKESNPRPGDAWLLADEDELVALIKAAKAQGLAIGSASGLGVISYNDTPLKEIIEGGTTVITADFHQMGLEAGALIKSGKLKTISVETKLIPRKTL